MHRLLVIGVTGVLALALCGTAAAWSWPADGAVLRSFTLGADPYAAGQHRGIDVGGADGSEVRAPATGVVSFAGSLPTYGNGVTISTGDGYAVTLVHLGSIGVSKGDTVTEGSAIGTMGSSGTPEQPVPSVHLGIRHAADAEGYVDPLGLLPPRAVPPAPAPEPAPTPVPAPVTTPVAVPTPPPSPPAAPVPAPPAPAPVEQPPPAASVPPVAPSAPAPVAQAPVAPDPVATAPRPGTAAPAKAPLVGSTAGSPAAPVVSGAPALETAPAVGGVVVQPAVEAHHAWSLHGGQTVLGSPTTSRGPVVEGAPQPKRQVDPGTRRRAGAGPEGAATHGAVVVAPVESRGETLGRSGRAHGVPSAPSPSVESGGATRSLPRADVATTTEALPEVASSGLGDVASPAGATRTVLQAADRGGRNLPAIVAAIALTLLLAGAAVRGAARRIGWDGAVLRHHADLLRQLDAAHRSRLYDRGRRRLRPPSAAARS